MIDVVINTGAAWSTTTKMWQDGDVFSAATNTTLLTSYADRLGYLKATLDAKPALADDNTWTGKQTFHPSANLLAAVQIYGELGFPGVGGDATGSGILYRKSTLTDASTNNISLVADIYYIPAITANRTYTFAHTGGNDGRRIRVVRPRSADAFSVTFLDAPAGNTIAVIPASTQGWIDFYLLGAMYPVGWSNGVTSILTDVI